VSAEIVSIDSKDISVEETLREMLADVESGEIGGKKVVAIALDDVGDNYEVCIRANNVRLSEIVCLLEYAKMLALEDMS